MPDSTMTTKPIGVTQTKPTAIMKRNPLEFILTGGQQLFALVAMGLYFQYFVYRTERLMDSYLNHHTFLQQLRESVAPSPDFGAPRYIIFNSMSESGQGLGNVMNGLLATHMLGLEFNRTVCVSEDWTEFHDAFHSLKGEECESIIPPEHSSATSISIVSFADPPNECRLQAKLSSLEPVLSIMCNTYPRWSLTPSGLWDAHYEPTEALINTLPYSTRPSTVVHLRLADDEVDKRAGLDTATLKKLGKKLPSDTFLVTNNVQWYHWFERFGWKHPGWHKVKHSALDGVEWAGDGQEEDSEQDRVMQLWSDWYTILRADHVYHTHSDFSLSAIHWNEIDSKTIQGTTDDGELKLTDEAWRVDEPMPRVVDRVGDQLKNCDKSTDDMIGSNFVGDEFEADDAPIDDEFDREHMDDVVGEDKYLIGRNPKRDKVFKDMERLRPILAEAGRKELHLLEALMRKEKPEGWMDDAVADARDPGILTEEEND